MNFSSLRIKLILAALFATGVFGLIAIPERKTVAPISMVDAILPERILS